MKVKHTCNYFTLALKSEIKGAVFHFSFYAPLVLLFPFMRLLVLLLMFIFPPFFVLCAC